MPVFDYRDPRPTPEAEHLYTRVARIARRRLHPRDHLRSPLRDRPRHPAQHPPAVRAAPSPAPRSTPATSPSSPSTTATWTPRATIRASRSSGSGCSSTRAPSAPTSGSASASAPCSAATSSRASASASASSSTSQFSYGYNLEIGDDCWIHRHVLLDDRGGITLHEGTSISDYANIYSHTHDLVDQRNVSNLRTEIGPRARITYHATVLAGTKVGPDAMLGALGLATRDIPAHTVALGIPAKPKLTK